MFAQPRTAEERPTPAAKRTRNQADSHRLFMVTFRNSEIVAFDDILYGVRYSLTREAVARAG
jgi:hypothetical protein